MTPNASPKASTSADERAVALALDHPLLAVDANTRGDLVGVLLARVGVREELVRLRVVEVVLRERRKELVAGQLSPTRIGDLLHPPGEVDLQPARQLEVVLRRHQVRDTALARLRVDADDRLVAAADVLRVDRQVRHVPDRRSRPLLRVHPLLDRVLVRAGERRVDEVARVRMTRVDG